jgi:hypothetical protein
MLLSGQQEVQRQLQSHYRRRLSHKRGPGRRPTSYHAGAYTIPSRSPSITARLTRSLALGYCRSGEIPIARCCFLPRCRLLRACLRRQQLQEFRHPRQLERRVLDPSQPYGSRKFSLCKLCLWDKDSIEDKTDSRQVVLGNKVDVEESKRMVR